MLTYVELHVREHTDADVQGGGGILVVADEPLMILFEVDFEEAEADAGRETEAEAEAEAEAGAEARAEAKVDGEAEGEAWPLQTPWRSGPPR